VVNAVVVSRTSRCERIAMFGAMSTRPGQEAAEPGDRDGLEDVLAGDRAPALSRPPLNG
jgi:hypothetical protein